MADERTLEAYEQHAREVAARDHSVDSPLRPYFAIAFPPSSKILDIGAGAGRELVALLGDRFNAYGVEPVDSLRLAAVERTQPTRMLSGALPNLSMNETFDGLVCSAVLQHLPRSQLFDAVLELRGLLRVGGRGLVSIPAGTRPGLDAEQRDSWGRLFSGVRPEELQLLFERVGFSTLARWESDDALGRPSVRWVIFLFELGAASGGRSIDQLATVISTKERKVATYKLALLRALNDIAMTQPHAAGWRDDGDVEVSIDDIASRWIEYYWRLFDAPKFLPQQQGEATKHRHVLKFARELEAMRSHYKLTGGLSEFKREQRQGLSARAVDLHRSLMRALRQTIFAGPVKYAGGALSSGRLFRREGSDRVVVPGGLWRELSLLGHWIGDALVLRWADLIERLSNGVRAGEAIDWLLPLPLEQRDTADVRKLFASGASCVWTSKRVSGQGLQIDHVLPWALWHNNDLWNLVPAAAAVNNSKSDGLPERHFLRARQHAIIDAWSVTRAAWPERFRRDASAQLGRLLERDEHALEELFDILTEAVERTRLQRGLPAWTPRRAA